MLNEYGANYPVCTNRVGHCAENYAVTGVLKKIDPGDCINDARILSCFQFTKAFNPRTWRNRDWCKNCHTLFD